MINSFIEEAYVSSYNKEMEKIGASLGRLSKELSNSSIIDILKRRRLKNSIKSAIKRADTKISVLKQQNMSQDNSKKILTALKNRMKRMEAGSGL